jgi:hypothetical protein
MVSDAGQAIVEALNSLVCVVGFNSFQRSGRGDLYCPAPR